MLTGAISIAGHGSFEPKFSAGLMSVKQAGGLVATGATAIAGGIGQLKAGLDGKGTAAEPGLRAGVA